MRWVLVFYNRSHTNSTLLATVLRDPHKPFGCPSSSCVSLQQDHVRAIIKGFNFSSIQGFGQRYKSLSKVIKKNFSGTMMEAFLFIVHGVKPKRDGKGIWRDAKNLEKTMAGLGTKDTMLIYRLVRAHWDSNRLKEVKDAYQRRYGKQLESRVKGETSGPYRDLLIAIVKGAAT